MRIGIDISQIQYEKTGVGRYVREMVLGIAKQKTPHTLVLFGASLRQQRPLRSFGAEVKKMKPETKLVIVPIPPTILDILWNKLHIIPITLFTGPLDVFWSSDWTQPPLGNIIGITTIHDLSFIRYPESFPEVIRHVQTRRLWWAKKECRLFLCDSEATKNDVTELLHIQDKQLMVIYPGFRKAAI